MITSYCAVEISDSEVTFFFSLKSSEYLFTVNAALEKAYIQSWWCASRYTLGHLGRLVLFHVVVVIRLGMEL